MKRLNPNDKEVDKVIMRFFSLYDSYYTYLQNEHFKSFLMSDGTNKDGQKRLQNIIKFKTCERILPSQIVILKDTSTCCY